MAREIRPSTGEVMAWEVRSIWIDPGYVDKALVLGALPAFILGTLIVTSLAHLGVSEVLSFTVSMPLLVFGWLYFVARLIEYWIIPTPKKRDSR
jgi:hypothetical protein